MCLGYSLCNWIDFGLSRIPESTTQWRVPLALSLLPALVILLSIFSLPESPRWLVQVNRVEEASHSLASLKGLSVTDETIRAEIAQSKGSLMEMFDPNDQERLFYRFCLCIVLQFSQQMCGGNLISVYASTIFEQNLGLSASLSKILAACALTWKLLCCFIAFFTIDRLGRRVVFMISGTGMAICMVALAITNCCGPTEVTIINTMHRHTFGQQLTI